MRILMQKRKKGIYSSWYTIEGIDLHGGKIQRQIYPSEARNYAQAIRFWKSKNNFDWVKATLLRNSSPLPTQYYC
jgi:hypothetical protein